MKKVFEFVLYGSFLIFMLIIGLLAGIGLGYLDELFTTPPKIEWGSVSIATPTVSERALHLESGELYIKNGHAEGIYISGGIMMCAYNEGACLHEVGHRLDEGGGKISETVEFREALDNFIAECVLAKDTWGEEDFFCNLARFPGINGNALNNWGGYGEAYAEMYKYNKQLGYVFPVELVEFFTFEIK